MSKGEKKCPWCKEIIKNPNLFYLYQFERKKIGVEHKTGLNGVTACFKCAKNKIINQIRDFEKK